MGLTYWNRVGPKGLFPEGTECLNDTMIHSRPQILLSVCSPAQDSLTHSLVHTSLDEEEHQDPGYLFSLIDHVKSIKNTVF